MKNNPILALGILLITVACSPTESIPSRTTFPLPAGERLHKDSIQKYFKGKIHMPKGVYDFGNAKLEVHEDLDITSDSAIITNVREIKYFPKSLRLRGLGFENINSAFIFQGASELDLEGGWFDGFTRAFVQMDTSTFNQVTIRNYQFLNANARAQTIELHGGHIKSLFDSIKFKDYDTLAYSTMIIGDPLFPTQSGGVIVQNSLWSNVRLYREKDGRVIDGGRYLCLIYGNNNTYIRNKAYDIATNGVYMRGAGNKVYQSEFYTSGSNDDSGVLLFKGNLEGPPNEIKFVTVRSDNKPALYYEAKPDLLVYDSDFEVNSRKAVDIHVSLGENVANNPLFKDKMGKVIFERTSIVNLREQASLGVTLKNVDTAIFRNSTIIAKTQLLGTYQQADSVNELTYLCLDNCMLESKGVVAQGLRSKYMEFINTVLIQKAAVRYPFNLMDVDVLITPEELTITGETQSIRKKFRTK